MQNMVCHVQTIKFHDFLRFSRSLRGGGWGFSPATINVLPGYFHRKIEEKCNQKKSPAV